LFEGLEEINEALGSEILTLLDAFAKDPEATLEGLNA
jgi:hypothetical protein